MTGQARIQTTEQPAWAIAYDVTCDVTDAYQEAIDPINENGEICVAFFNHEAEEVDPSNPYEKCWFENFPKLTGICIEDGHGPSYVERANAIRLLGADVIERAEAAAKGVGQ